MANRGDGWRVMLVIEDNNVLLPPMASWPLIPEVPKESLDRTFEQSTMVLISQPGPRLNEASSLMRKQETANLGVLLGHRFILDSLNRLLMRYIKGKL
jgi:hypothetical protein